MLPAKVVSNRYLKPFSSFLTENITYHSSHNVTKQPRKGCIHIDGSFDYVQVEDETVGDIAQGEHHDRDDKGLYSQGGGTVEVDEGVVLGFCSALAGGFTSGLY